MHIRCALEDMREHLGEFEQLVEKSLCLGWSALDEPVIFRDLLREPVEHPCFLRGFRSRVNPQDIVHGHDFFELSRTQPFR